MRWFHLPKRHDKLTGLYDTQTSIEPAPQFLYRPLQLTPPSKVRVVIMGAEPYRIYGPNVNDGLAWSALPNAPKKPKPLRNIIKEYQDDLGFREPLFKTLRPWSEQGVLLINSTWCSKLDGTGGRYYYHSDSLTWEIIYKLNRKHKGIVFMFWGPGFRRWAPLIDRDKHAVINYGTPTDKMIFDDGRYNNIPFFGSKCFTEVSKLLGVSTNMWRLV